MTVRLDRLQRGLFEALNGVADDVVWEPVAAPRRQFGDTLLTLALTAGPSPGLRDGARGTMLEPAASVVVRLLGATVGKRIVVELNGFAYRHDVAGGESITDVRDALLADIADDDAVSVTATADDVDGISLVANFAGGIRTLRLSGDVAADPPVYSAQHVLVTEGTCLHLVTINAFSRALEPRLGAAAIIDAALGRLRRVSVSEELARYGLGLWSRGTVAKLDAIAGASWETRRAVDVTVAARTVEIDDVEPIENVVADVTVEGAV